ncbi:sugar transferase [Carnobacterium alterfunditum]|uniref:sugar transferase n=1 Tax=Carnobacterium alterfunditum TaxID=28230 RepID=UPI0035934CF9
MYQKLFKRVIDIVLSSLGLIILSPVFLIVIITIKLSSKGPILFKQKRVGKDKVLFIIYKFRTMKIDTPKDAPTHLLKNPDSYITKVGKLLRKTSLDELPQLINILKGEMSVIGPRPALWNQYDLITERDKYQANDIYPGLTGWAQINGRDELPIQKKAALDGVYMKKISVFFDIKCFIGTIISVMKNDGVVEGGTGKLSKSPEILNNLSEETVSK